MLTENQQSSGDGDVTLRELLRRITDDLRTIARDEVELVGGELARVAKRTAAEAAMVLFGGIVALIGLAMLCVAAVVALEPVISSLALRLVLMAIVYVVFGAVLATTFGMRLRRDIVPNFQVPIYEAKSTIEGARAIIEERGRHFHA
jgi:hypothetical protein